MKRQRLIVLALILTASLVGQQVEHAPTVAQCQADQRLWASEIKRGDDTSQPAYNVMTKRLEEMMNCREVDPENNHIYYNVGAETGLFQATRMLHYLQRHNMLTDFKTEDAAGKR